MDIDFRLKKKKSSIYTSLHVAELNLRTDVYVDGGLAQESATSNACSELNVSRVVAGAQ